MKKTMAIMLLLVLVSAVLLAGCAKKTGTSEVKDIAVTQPEVSSSEMADEAATGWVDEGDDVQIGEII
jgi:uncharacterized lipoprotein YajG